MDTTRKRTVGKATPHAMSGALFARTAEFVRDFLRYAGGKGMLAAVFIALGALLESVGIMLLVPILAVVLETDRKSGWLETLSVRFFAFTGAQTHLQRLGLLLCVFAVLIIARALVISVRDVTVAQLQIGFVGDLRSRITRKLAMARWDVVARLRHARISYLMSSDIESIGLATHFLLQCAVSLTILAVQCALALALAPILAVLAIALLAAGGLAVAAVMRQARLMGKFSVDSNMSLMDSTAQFLGGIKLAVSQNLQESFLAEFHDTLHRLTARQIEFSRRRTNARLAATTLSALVGALAVLIGYGILHIPAPVLLAVLLLLGRMNGPAIQIQQGAQQFALSLPAYEQIKELEEELTASAQDGLHAAAREVPTGSIVFRNVSFAYAADGDGAPISVLRNLNATIAPGSFVGICGASGAGKTTFADLLVGLFPPQSGEISVGGGVLHGPLLAAWKDHISYVSQDPFLFYDTIRRNLLWAAPQADEDELWNALRLAGAEQLVRGMAEGLETVVGERGTLVSGGERQRLALARAVLRRPRLLVLDEATNAIDIASERGILQHLLALDPRPTIVMIAHRVESVDLCERVLTLDDGKFVETAAARFA